MSSASCTEKDAFFERLEHALEMAKTQKDLPLDKATKEKIYKTLKSSIHRGHESICSILSIFIRPMTKIEWILAERRDLLPSIWIFLKKVGFISHILIFYVKQIIEAIVKRENESEDEEEIRDLLFAQIEISNEIKDDEYFRGVEKRAIEALSARIGIQWRFVGKEGYQYREQKKKVPVFVCEITSHQPVEIDSRTKPVDQRIEECLESGDRYFIFPKTDTVTYGLKIDQKKLLYMYAKHLLLIAENSNEKTKAQAVSHLLIQEGYSTDALLIYAASLVDRPVATLSLVEHAITLEDPVKEREHEIAWAHALVGTGSHTAAIPLFEKHRETDKLIMSLICAGKTEIAKPLLQDKIEGLRNNLSMHEVASGVNGMLKKTWHSKESMNLLIIELASLLYVLGCLENSTDTIREAFNLIKTPKYAKCLSTRLLLENKHEEALFVLKECKFEVLDVDTLLLTALSLAKSKKFEEAERILKYAEVFSPKNEKIDQALQSILIQQGKIEEALDNLLIKIKTYTPNILRDCHILFQCSNSFMMFKYTESALLALYYKTGQLPLEWMEDLLRSAEAHKGAKEAFLSVSSQIKSLSLVDYIEKALEYPHTVTAETEYYARKRLIEYAIHTRKYKYAHEHLTRMKSLSSQINQNQDYLDTVYTFYKSQQIAE